MDCGGQINDEMFYPHDIWFSAYTYRRTAPRGLYVSGALFVGLMYQAYSRLSTTHGHITDCELLLCMYWTRLVLVRPAASLYSSSLLKHHPRVHYPWVFE